MMNCWEFNSHMSQLVEVLFADGSGLGGPCLSVANGIWVDTKFTLLHSYRTMAENTYKAVVDCADFLNKTEEAIKKINTWAANKTNGLITQMLGNSDVAQLKESALISGNAIYFKGAWTTPFEEYYTSESKFFLLNGNSIDTPFMRSYGYKFISAFDGFKVSRLTYKCGEDKRSFSMYMYLPDSKDGLHTLIEKFTTEEGFVEHHLPRKLVPVGDFRIPKFKMCFKFEASEVLKKLGIVSVFAGGLTKVVDTELHVSRILHKACIEVNEGGTEAAAVTLEEYDMCCADYSSDEEEKVDFVANHPFLFVIREDVSGALLFVGQVLNPLNEDESAQ